MELLKNITLIHGDCMDYMKTLPDKSFNLAVVDPPYGIGKNWTKDRNSKFYKHNSSYKNDCIPSRLYFDELFRVSKNQIIWGANYFTNFLPARSSWIVWDKKRDWKKQKNAEGELAWTSYNIPLRIAEYRWCGACTCEQRYGKHPHEKPVSLYKWILSEYAKKGDKILDTHLGGGSICIAADSLGFEMTGIEIDEHYYNDTKRRVIDFQKQTRLF